jgi:hypothetical protein
MNEIQNVFLSNYEYECNYTANNQNCNIIFVKLFKL